MKTGDIFSLAVNWFWVDVFRNPARIRAGVACCLVFEPGDGSAIIKSITLTLKETVCPKSEDYLKEECVFKENGSLKRCSSTATVLKSQPGQAASVTVSCEEVTDPEERKELSEPPSWTKFFNNW